MEKVNMLKGLIEVYQNDFDCGYNDEDKEELRPIIQNLIIEVSRLVNDIRYCSKKDCPCCPEYEIKRIIKRHGDQLDKVMFAPYGLTEVNMPKVKNELLSL